MMDRKFDVLDPLRLSRKSIVTIAERLTKKYARLHEDFPADLFTINFDLVYDDLIYPQYGISLEVGDDLGYQDGEKVLGYFDAWTNTIALDAVLADKDKRFFAKRVFTAWHELGHAVLHGEWMRVRRGRYKNGRIITVDSAISPETTEKLEQQANLFASHAAAPQWFLDFVLESTFRLNRPIRYIGPRTYWLDVRGCRRLCPVNSFHELCIDIAYHIRHRFGGLSVEALSYRVRESAWLTDITSGSETFQMLRTMPVPAESLVVTT